MEIQQLQEHIEQLQVEHDHALGHDFHPNGTNQEDDVPSDVPSKHLINSSTVVV